MAARKRRADGLFTRGGHPSPEAHAKMLAGVRKYRVEHPSKGDIAIAAALAFFRAELEAVLAEIQQDGATRQ